MPSFQYVNVNTIVSATDTFVIFLDANSHVDIAALSETRIANEGQLTEDGGGYCFFWSGRTSEERREACVGFAIRFYLVSKLASLPRGLNDRLVVMQLQLTNKQKATLISAFAPTMTNPEEVKDQFYEQLDALIAAVPKSEKLIILGDFNAWGRRRPPHMVMSYWPTRYRQMQQQWYPTPTDLYCPGTRRHQHVVPSTNQQQDDNELKALASD